MIRVLQCVNNMHRAGLETVLMNYYRNIDRTQIQFDFLTHRPDRDDYDDEIEALGGRIYRAPRLYPKNYPAYFAFMKDFFREHPEYRIIHSHIDAMSYLPLLAAKKAGVPIRIAHSHSTSIEPDWKRVLKQYFRYRLPSVANRFCACGEQAGQFLFRGKPFETVVNGVDCEAFAFSDSVRVQKRKELGVEDAFVVGHIGRLSYPKNHLFLLDIFGAICEKEPRAVLLLAGKGEKEAQLRQRVQTLGLHQKVRFLGSRSDVSALYQAMDVFVMPSLYEGVPTVGVEAQIAGLPCYFSEPITGEVAFTDRCRFLSLELAPAGWAEEILKTRTQPRSGIALQNCPYDIQNACRRLEAYYKGQDTEIG